MDARSQVDGAFESPLDSGPLSATPVDVCDRDGRLPDRTVGAEAELLINCWIATDRELSRTNN